MSLSTRGVKADLDGVHPSVSSSTSSKRAKTSGAGCSRLTTVVSRIAWVTTRSHFVTVKVVAESSPAQQSWGPWPRRFRLNHVPAAFEVRLLVCMPGVDRATVCSLNEKLHLT